MGKMAVPGGTMVGIIPIPEPKIDQKSRQKREAKSNTKAEAKSKPAE